MLSIGIARVYHDLYDVRLSLDRKQIRLAFYSKHIEIV